MKTKTITQILVGLLAASSSFLGAETEVPHVFTPGEPASAAQVNENFASLATAINDLAAQIAALETPAGTPGGVVGTYKVVSTQTEFFGQNLVEGGYAEHNAFVAEAELQIRIDGTFSLNISEFEHRLASIGDDVLQKLQIKNAPTTESMNGTWSKTGPVVTLTVGTEELVRVVASLSGEVLLKANNELSVEGNYRGGQAGIFVGVKVSNP